MATYTPLRNKVTGKVTAHRFQIRIKGFPPQTRQFQTKAKGQRWANKVENAMRDGTWVNTRHNAQWTLSKAIGCYIDEVHLNEQVSTSFGKSKLNGLKRIAKYPISQIPIPELGSNHFFEFAKWRRKTVGAKATGDDIGYMNKALKFVMGVKQVAEANRQLQIAKPVLTDYGLIGPSNDRERRLKPGEFERLMSVPHIMYNGNKRSTDRYKTRLKMKYIIPLALETTMREAELARMEERHINWDKKELLIEKRKHPTLKETNDQLIPLTEEAIKVLREYLALGIHTEGKPLIWPVNARNISDMFNTFCKIAKINEEGTNAKENPDNLTFHDLRHEAISRLFALGYSQEMVCVYSGHKDTKSLMRYVQLTPADVHRAREIRSLIMEHRLDTLGAVQFNSSISAADSAHCPSM